MRKNRRFGWRYFGVQIFYAEPDLMDKIRKNKCVSLLAVLYSFVLDVKHFELYLDINGFKESFKTLHPRLCE